MINKYTKEDREFIESWLNKCIKIQTDDHIFYITSDNIVRQLKYNQLLKKKKIKINFNKMTYINNVILRQDLKTKIFLINYYEIHIFFQIKYQYNYDEIKILINNILCDILNVNEYMTFANYSSSEEAFNLLNLKECSSNII